MNKKLVVFLPLLLLGSLTGCNNDPSDILLTRGTLYREEVTHLSSGEFDTMMANKENFLMAIYPEKSNCYCWRNFEYVLNKAVKNNHYQIYTFFAEDVASNTTMRKITGFYAYNDRPTFYILSNGWLAKSYDYSDANPIYKNEDDFLKEINKRTIAPRLMEVDDDYLTHAIENETEVNVCIARDTCSDTSYATYNVVTPFFKNNRNKYCYYLNIDPYRSLGDEIYQGIKDKYMLSTANNPDLGFGLGVVPTYQHYNNGKLTDMCVYLNDGELTYNEEDKGYYALGSYYNEDRINKMHYLSDVTNKDLTKVKYNENDVISFGEKHYLKNDAAAKYHNVILNSFLKTYLS